MSKNGRLKHITTAVSIVYMPPFVPPASGGIKRGGSPASGGIKGGDRHRQAQITQITQIIINNEVLHLCRLVD